MASLASHELQRALQHRSRVPERRALAPISSSLLLRIVHHHNVQQLRRLRHLQTPLHQRSTDNSPKMPQNSPKKSEKTSNAEAETIGSRSPGRRRGERTSGNTKSRVDREPESSRSGKSGCEVGVRVRVFEGEGARSAMTKASNTIAPSRSHAFHASLACDLHMSPLSLSLSSLSLSLSLSLLFFFNIYILIY